MNIQSDSLSPYINYLSLTLRPDIHNNYAVTVFKHNEEVTVELINNQAKVSNDKITEYWNMQTMQTVNDQITDAVTVTETTGNQIDTFIVDEPVKDITVDSEITDNTVNLNDSVPKTAKVLEN